MNKKMRKIMKGLNRMKNEIINNEVEVIRAKSEVLKDVSSDANVLDLIGTVCIGIGVIGILLKISSSRMRKESTEE